VPPVHCNGCGRFMNSPTGNRLGLFQARCIFDSDELATVNPGTIGVANSGGRNPLIVPESSRNF